MCDISHGGGGGGGCADVAHLFINKPKTNLQI